MNYNNPKTNVKTDINIIGYNLVCPKEDRWNECSPGIHFFVNGEI